MFRDKWVPVTMVWRVLRLQMEERSQVWRGAANIFKKQSQTADKGSPPALGSGEVLTTPPRQNISCYESFTQHLRTG